MNDYKQYVGKLCSIIGSRTYTVEFYLRDSYECKVYEAKQDFVVLEAEGSNTNLYCKVLCYDGAIGSLSIPWKAIKLAGVE